MLCPYCEETELIESLYYICPKCKIAMTRLELQIAIRANEDVALMERLAGQKVLRATKEVFHGSSIENAAT